MTSVEWCKHDQSMALCEHMFTSLGLILGFISLLLLYSVVGATARCPSHLVRFRIAICPEASPGVFDQGTQSEHLNNFRRDHNAISQLFHAIPSPRGRPCPNNLLDLSLVEGPRAVTRSMAVNGQRYVHC